MRTKACFAGIAVACAATLAAATAVAGDDDVVYLDAPALAHPRASNPNHYAQVRRILTAANYLCRPRAADTYLATTLGAQDLSCERMLLKLSNPPQREIRFRLDETRYVASVFITDDPPRLIPAR